MECTYLILTPSLLVLILQADDLGECLSALEQRQRGGSGSSAQQQRLSSAQVCGGASRRGAAASSTAFPTDAPLSARQQQAQSG